MEPIQRKLSYIILTPLIRRNRQVKCRPLLVTERHWIGNVITVP